MKVTLIVALVLAVSLVPADAWWGGYGWGWPYYGYSGLWGGYGYGLGYGWGGYYGKRDVEEVPQDFLNRTECYYNVELEMIRCQSPTGQTECETELRCDLEEFEPTVYGIALFDDSKETNRYRLISRKMDNTAWVSKMWVSETTGLPSYPSLFFGESPELRGLRVRDETCYAEMVEILNGSNRYERVMVEEETTPVVVIGDIITVEPQPREELRESSGEQLENRLNALETKMEKLEKRQFTGAYGSRRN